VSEQQAMNSTAEWMYIFAYY